MKNTSSQEQLTILVDTFNTFGRETFSRKQFIEVFGDFQSSNSFLGNGKAKGWLESFGRRSSFLYQLTDVAISIVTKELVPPAGPPIPEPVNAKSPEAILRQVRRQLEDQIDLIDEALENINRSNDDAAKYRAIEKLIKG